MISKSPQSTRTIQGAPYNSSRTNYPISFLQGVNIMICGGSCTDPLPTEEYKRVLTVLYQMATGQDGTLEETKALINGSDTESFMEVVIQTANRINELETTNQDLEYKLETFRHQTTRGAPSNSPQTNYPTSLPASSTGPNTDFFLDVFYLLQGVNVMIRGGNCTDPLPTEECKRFMTFLYQISTGQDGTSGEAKALTNYRETKPFIEVVIQTANRINELEATNKALEHKLEVFRRGDKMVYFTSQQRYQMVNKITGTIRGQLIKCFDTVTQTDVVIKQSHINPTNNFENPEEEIRILIQLQNSNIPSGSIVRIIDSFYDQKTKLIHAVFPFYSHGDLFDYLPMCTNANCKSEVVGGIMEAVRQVHRHEIAHLDVSLENLLLDSEKNVKLCDFGLARNCFNSNISNIGKVVYMAPEIKDHQLQRQSYDARFADMYSLGICLFILFTGFQPYQSHGDIAFRILSNEGIRYLLIEYRLELPENFIKLLEVLLCKYEDRLSIDGLYILYTSLNINGLYGQLITGKPYKNTKVITL